MPPRRCGRPEPGRRSVCFARQTVGQFRDFGRIEQNYLTLSDAYLRLEGSKGLNLMDEIERNLTEALRRFVTETPHGVARPDIILIAARKLRALLEAGREVPAGACTLQ